MSGKSVFFTGATGYIGGQVLQAILASSTPPKSITALTRNEKKAELLKSITLPSGTTLTPLVGELDDTDKITEAVSQADIVIHTAHADHVASIKAIIEGMKQRKEKTGHRSLLIHTSGTGTLIDNAKGQYPNDKIYTDLNPTPATSSSPALLSIETLPASALHRDVDLLIIEADAAGICKSYIILPSTIWGEGKGELYEKGIANSFSDQIPTLVRAALDRGQAGMVGKGANIWPHVNIGDLGHLYRLVYERSQKGDIGHGKSGYYFGVSGEYTLLAAVETIGSTLVDKKWGSTSQAQTFSPEEMKKYYGGSDYMGSNARAVASRSKSIGWKPKYHGLDDFTAYIRSETVRIEGKFGKEWPGEGKSNAWQK